MLLTPVTLAAILLLIPYFAAAFFPQILTWTANRRLAIALPAVLCIPYALVAWSTHIFSWTWFIIYAALPCAIAALMWQARRSDPHQRGDWRDFFVLIILGLIVDLRWFERAWPAHLAVFNKILLLDAGIYAFLAIRRLDGVGFSLRLRPRDVSIGLREFLIFAPIAIVLGFTLGFLHLHAVLPHLLRTLGAFAFTFFFIAVPEELFFRGWLQNLLERRIGRTLSLLVTAILFGLSHFNKRAVHFNWRYVLLAAIAGIFYGRAWRDQRRVGASSITHATVDTIWGIWFR
jgi:uncharacterized protein